jgi:hypothetical protein
MGEKLPFGGTVFLSDGTKFCEVKEIPVFTETYDPDNPPPPMPLFNADYEITATIDLSTALAKAMRRTLLGWTARGPLRLRQVRKALRSICR